MSSAPRSKSIGSSDGEEGESSMMDYSGQSVQMDLDETIPLNNDMSQLTSRTKKKTINGMPQHHLTGKHKSLTN